MCSAERVAKKTVTANGPARESIPRPFADYETVYKAISTIKTPEQQRSQHSDDGQRQKEVGGLGTRTESA